ncbi:GyrI-like domain-containing protein [Flavihumibacter cheonanensis]|uniref:GyrI-like domain-containing protein n=1 Tax=Flavihumibacter cheonanensis TaxID=1442385 RepID=UPI001EF8CB71|nr:effector binding domain-containing protein [Flavihumibacter cheonanensis]MCG7750932.1 effector binding domain-containing protein [Flavihumibacter cheonanensis]
MSQINISSMKVIGITVRTSNAAGASGTDIPELWNRFLSEAILLKIPNRINDTIYCVYTYYEGDHTKPYTTLLGCQVTELDTIPHGMTGIEIPKGIYEQVSVTGNLMNGIVFEAWMDIWQRPLNRTYIADFEVYDEKAADMTNAEVNIFVGVQN